MELCPKRKKTMAEKNHYTGKIVCFNRYCGSEEDEPSNYDYDKNKEKYIHKLYTPEGEKELLNKKPNPEKEAIENDEICKDLNRMIKAYRTRDSRPNATELAINALKILYKWRKEEIRRRLKDV